MHAHFHFHRLAAATQAWTSLSAGAALRKAYVDLRAHGETSADIDLYSFEEFNKLLGFQDVWDFERKFAQTP